MTEEIKNLTTRIENTFDTEGNPRSYTTSDIELHDLVYRLVAALKETITRIESLETRVTRLEGV